MALAGHNLWIIANIIIILIPIFELNFFYYVIGNYIPSIIINVATPKHTGKIKVYSIIKFP